ncbi:MAG: hypothetical protein REI96_20675 [Flavobacterium nitrogenifigens]|nr:hypothetical protein [Flavobacterium nitrogenifigens]MDQ8014875.1 hypothetical protein [Flavobacterium nitrogenifigens]
MTFEDRIQKINLEMMIISKKMNAVLEKNKPTAVFVKEMYNNFRIICL